MAWYIKKTSLLSDAVPTDGVMYRTSNGHWSNVYEERESFDTQEAATTAVGVNRGGGIITMPNGITILED